MSFLKYNSFAQKIVSLDVNIETNKINNYLEVNIKNISSDTLVITNCINTRFLYEDSLSGDKDYALYYKYFFDNLLAGLEHQRNSFVKVAPNKTIQASFSYLFKEKQSFTIRVYNEKLKEGTKIIVTLKPNKFIEYKRKENYYEIETKFIKTFYE